MEKNRLISFKDNISDGLGEPLFFENTTEKYMEKTRTNVSTSFREKDDDDDDEEKDEDEVKGEEIKEDKDDLFSLKNVDKNEKI